MDELAEVVVDGANPTDLHPGVRYVAWSTFPAAGRPFPEWDAIDSVTSRKLRFTSGDTLFGKIRPYFHKVVWAPFDGAASSDTIVMRPLDRSNSALVNSIRSSDQLVAVSVATSNGTKMPRADAKALLAHRIALPPPRSQLLVQFQRTVEAWLATAAGLVVYNRELAATRDLPLPRLVTGRLDISDIDLGDLLSTEAP